MIKNKEKETIQSFYEEILEVKNAIAGVEERGEDRASLKELLLNLKALSAKGDQKAFMEEIPKSDDHKAKDLGFGLMRYDLPKSVTMLTFEDKIVKLEIKYEVGVNFNLTTTLKNCFSLT